MTVAVHESRHETHYKNSFS